LRILSLLVISFFYRVCIRTSRSLLGLATKAAATIAGVFATNTHATNIYLNDKTADSAGLSAEVTEVSASAKQ